MVVITKIGTVTSPAFNVPKQTKQAAVILLVNQGDWLNPGGFIYTVSTVPARLQSDLA